jgi:Tfp pilus assembly protein PilZ
MEERRKARRLKTQERTVVSKPEGSNAECSILDISTGGMRILLDDEATIGTQISGQFKILPAQGPFYVKGEVAWVRPCQENPGSAGFEIGIKFNKISARPI